MLIDEECFKCTIPVEYCTGKKINCWEHYQRKLQAKTNREFKATVKKVHPPRKPYKSENYKKWGKNRYNRLKAEGICTQCAKQPAVEGQTLCETCKERMKGYNSRKRPPKNYYSKELYRELVKNGVCPSCRKRPAMVGSTLCEHCFAIHTESNRKYMQKRKNKANEQR